MSQKQERSKPRDPESGLIKGSSRPTKADVQRSYTEGFNDGLEKGRLEIIDFLERAYLSDEGRPDRGTPQAAAILELAAHAAEHFRPLVGKGHKKKGRKK